MGKDFAVFIMVYGRPDKMYTYNTLKKQGYTGKIYLVADNTDETVDSYKEKYGKELIIFDKKEASLKMDSGDNSGDLRSTLYSANTIFDLAKERGIKYFFIMCDDYIKFDYRTNKEGNYPSLNFIIKDSLDKVFKIILKYYKSISAKTIAFSQGGDFIGGKDNSYAKKSRLTRKAMNSFLCSTDRPFEFMGRLNEDITTYVNLGSKGNLFFTISIISLTQNPTLETKGGLSDVYLDYGTYVKSFFSLMYNPSSVRIMEIGTKNKRIHHKVKWNNAVPKIVREDYRIIA